MIGRIKNGRIVKSGLTGELGNELLNGVIGQMSDGMWENTRGYKKYWSSVEIDDDNNFIVSESFFDNGFYGMTDKQVRQFFARKMNAVYKEWKANYPYGESVDYLTYKMKATPKDVENAIKTLRKYE